MKYKEAQSLEYKAQVPSFIRRMKGENLDGDAEEEEEIDEFGRSRQKRSEVVENEEEEDEKSDSPRICWHCGSIRGTKIRNLNTEFDTKIP